MDLKINVNSTGPLGYTCIIETRVYPSIIEMKENPSDVVNEFTGHGYTAPEAIINAARAWAYDIAVKNDKGSNQ